MYDTKQTDTIIDRHIHMYLVILLILIYTETVLNVNTTSCDFMLSPMIEFSTAAKRKHQAGTIFKRVPHFSTVTRGYVSIRGKTIVTVSFSLILIRITWSS